MTAKQQLRKSFRAVRQSAKSPLKDDAIFRLLIDSGILERADIVFAYSSVSDEVNTDRIIEYLSERGIPIALPVCLDDKGNMEFRLLLSSEYLKKGMYSIYEPDDSLCPRAYSTEKSICIAPGLAFDREGYRLGYGKGYYDRFLSDFKGTAVGLCYRECFTQALPVSPYDRKVNYIITDKKIYTIKEEYING